MKLTVSSANMYFTFDNTCTYMHIHFEDSEKDDLLYKEKLVRMLEK